MTKTQIFEEVVKITHMDASCCKDEPGADSEIYRRQITDDMDDEAFLYLMQSYIATFHVLAHLSFFRQDRNFLSFRVKRYEDALYVFDTAPVSTLKVGDKIVQIDGLSVRDYADKHAEMLYGEPESRQGFCWRKLLTYAKELGIETPDDGIRTVPNILTDTWDATEPYFCKKLRKNVVYMRLEDFGDDAAITKMYKEQDMLLRNSEYLVIDVRSNGGGNDSAYLPLLEFCLPEGENADILNAESMYDSGIEINYSVRNCDQRIARFEERLRQDLPQDTRNMLSTMLEQLKQNRGKGFIPFADMGSEMLPYIGTALPKHVYIITDEECGSSGDSFVETMRKSPKVTTVGRPTMGILDFSNCASVNFDNYTLFYPTSRSLYLDNGVQMRGNGIPVNIPISWTPEHLVRDVDLDTVLELIEKEA